MVMISFHVWGLKLNDLKLNEIKGGKLKGSLNIMTRAYILTNVAVAFRK